MSRVHFDDVRRTVLVTGATGFVGAELVRALLDDGHDVLVLSRRPDEARAMFGGRVHAVAALRELPADTRVDVIVNLAGARILDSLERERADFTP